MSLNLARVNADLMKIRDERAESITIRRGDSTLSVQTVRIEKVQSYGLQVRSLNGKEYRATILVLGDTDLDIAVEDRFNDASGNLNMVIYVNPNHDACTVAEATAVE